MSECCQQRYEFDCFLACIAAASGDDYDRLWHDTVEYRPPPAPNIGAHNFVQRMLDKRGIYGNDIPLCFERAGLEYQVLYVSAAENDCVKRMLWNRRAILQVPSLNHEGGTHIVYWDGERVRDPSPKQKYHWLQSILIQNVWLLPAPKESP